MIIISKRGPLYDKDHAEELDIVRAKLHMFNYWDPDCRTEETYDHGLVVDDGKSTVITYDGPADEIEALKDWLMRLVDVEAYK